MGDILKNGKTYVFPTKQRSMSTTSKTRHRIWQIGPSTVASLMCIPFGIMLGWPSPTYPKLLPKFSANSPINITTDQSAMIAGFLMIGNTLGTPFSSISIVGAKYGITLGLLLMLAGWTVMRFANSIYWLLGSRLLVGLGCGYGMGQLKMYIKNMSQPTHSQMLTKLTTFYTYFGVTVAFTLGYLTSFTCFSTVAIIITTVIILLCLLLPHPPMEYLMGGQEEAAKMVLVQVNPSVNTESEIQQLKVSLDSPSENMSFLQVCRDIQIRKYVLILCVLTIFQQFTGAPATIVYTQLIFMESSSHYPELCAIAYSVLFFISNFIGTFFMNSFSKKSCLLFSSVSVTLALSLNITVFYFNLNNTYWRYTSLITMFLFIFVHSTGLATVPLKLTQEYFPATAVTVIVKAQIMLHSMLALIITKIFQVLYSMYNLYVPFCLFLSVSLASSVFIWFIVPYESTVLDVRIKQLNKPAQSLTKT